MSEFLNKSPLTIPSLQAGKPEITMAPLIDVVFLLLIFFIVTTVFPENRGLVIEKPESEYSEAISKEKIIFIVTKDGKVFFKGQHVTYDDVERLVREQLIAAADSVALLQVDRKATTDVLIKVMDACKLGGLSQVGIATKTINRER